MFWLQGANARAYIVQLVNASRHEEQESPAATDKPALLLVEILTGPISALQQSSHI